MTELTKMCKHLDLETYINPHVFLSHYFELVFTSVEVKSERRMLELQKEIPTVELPRL
jgi:hypothetical protein